MTQRHGDVQSKSADLLTPIDLALKTAQFFHSLCI